MEYLKITNKGEIDPRALTLQGASTKRDELGFIGNFGSGNKYALATLLRFGYSVRVFSGKREIIITTKEERFRDKTFNILHVDGQATSITMETGQKWTVEHAIREFWSNALDEGEAERSSAFIPEGQPGITSIFISFSEPIRNMLTSWDLYFLPPTSPAIYTDRSDGTIHLGLPANYFRRGVWISEDREWAPMFNYNFTDFSLPETRQVDSGTCARAIYKILYDCDNPTVLDAILDAGQTSIKIAEWRALELCGSGKVMTHLQKRLTARGYSYIGNMAEKGRIPEREWPTTFWLTPSKYVVVSDRLKDIHKQVTYNRPYTLAPWPIGLQAKVTSAVTFLARHGVSYDGISISYGSFSESSVIAFADMDLKLCIISDEALSAPDDLLYKALIEEWTHLRHGVFDHTVEQQHVYLGLICSLMGVK